MKLFYLRDENRTPVGIVASEKDEDGDVRFAVSTWNPLDDFDRRIGRKIAIDRLNMPVQQGNRTKQLFDYPLNMANSDLGIKARIIITIAFDHMYPKRMRRAALVWLSEKDILPIWVKIAIAKGDYGRNRKLSRRIDDLLDEVQEHPVT